jgi:hypothetical protein
MKICKKTLNKLLLMFYREYVSEFGESTSNLSKKEFHYQKLYLPELMVSNTLSTSTYLEELRNNGFLTRLPKGTHYCLTSEGLVYGRELSAPLTTFFLKHWKAIIAVVGAILGIVKFVFEQYL